MFEKFRVRALKKVLEGLLLAELQHHTKALQDLSVVFEAIKKVHED